MSRGSYVIFSAQYPPHLGGIETFTKGLARQLASEGDEVCVVTNDTESQGAGFSSEDGITVLRLPCLPLFGGRLPLPVPTPRRMRLMRQLRGRSFDGVLVNARFYPHSLSGMRLARRQGMAPVVLDHGSAYLSFGSPAADVAVRLHEHAITWWGRLRFRPRYYGISEKSVAWLRTFGIEGRGTLSNFIDAASFRASASSRRLRDELGIGEDALLVAFIGRLIPEKGVRQLIEASRSEELRRRGVVFVLAGDGPLSAEVEGAVSPSLRWVGPLGRQDCAALLRDADVLCLPTRSEGFSTTLLEASACGCPSVVTDVGGARELIPGPACGTIIDAMDAGCITRALSRLADDRSLLAEQSLRCQERVEGSFTPQETARRLREAFAEARRG